MRYIILLLFFLNFYAFAEEPPISFSKAVKLAAPSVVNIYTITPDDNSDDADRTSSYRLGSGVIMDKEGHILTNYHVVSKASAILVVLPNGEKVRAKVLGADPEVDLEVMQISAKNFQPIPIGNSHDLQIGDVVLAIGNPFGLGQTVTHGIISAMGRNTAEINQLENYIQIDAALNPGNSGGALINTQGKLIGITVGIYSRSGGFQGVGFAIPVDVALNIMNQIIKNGRVDRAYLGVNVVNNSEARGVRVVQVVPKSPADSAGIKVNDDIVQINEYSVENSRGFLNYIAQQMPGNEVILQVVRDKKPLEIKVKTGVRPPPPLLDDRGQPHKPNEEKDLPDHVG